MHFDRELARRSSYTRHTSPWEAATPSANMRENAMCPCVNLGWLMLECINHIPSRSFPLRACSHIKNIVARIRIACTHAQDPSSYVTPPNAIGQAVIICAGIMFDIIPRIMAFCVIIASGLASWPRCKLYQRALSVEQSARLSRLSNHPYIKRNTNKHPMVQIRVIASIKTKQQRQQNMLTQRKTSGCGNIKYTTKHKQSTVQHITDIHSPTKYDRKLTIQVKDNKQKKTRHTQKQFV